jgi:hypothetical protein
VPESNLPERLAVVVMWSRKRRAVFGRFAVLSFTGPIISLRDRDGDQLFEVTGPDLRVRTPGRRKLELTPTAGPPFYIEGPYAQLARNKGARRLMEAYQAVVAPPRIVPMKDRQWASLTRSTSPHTIGFNRMTQAVIWRRVLLAFLWDRRARLPDQASSPPLLGS